MFKLTRKKLELKGKRRGMVSVIIPTYNRAHSIRKSIGSVLNQTYSDLELIIVDDGSTDDTRSVVENVKDCRIRYVFQENAGACIARNRGIDLAKGDYIAFQDSDDVWLPEKLERQLDILKKTDADIVFCKLLSYVNGKFNGLYPRNLKEGFLEPVENIFGIGTQALIAKNSVFKEIHFDPDMPRWQDFEWILRATQKYTIYCLDAGLVEYHLRDDSITKNPLKLLGACRIINRKNPNFANKYPIMADSVYFALVNAGEKMYDEGNKDYRKFLSLAGRFTRSRKQKVRALIASTGLWPLYMKVRRTRRKSVWGYSNGFSDRMEKQ